MRSEVTAETHPSFTLVNVCLSSLPELSAPLVLPMCLTWATCLSPVHLIFGLYYQLSLLCSSCPSAISPFIKMLICTFDYIQTFLFLDWFLYFCLNLRTFSTTACMCVCPLLVFWFLSCSSPLLLFSSGGEPEVSPVRLEQIVLSGPVLSAFAGSPQVWDQQTV